MAQFVYNSKDKTVYTVVVVGYCLSKACRYIHGVWIVTHSLLDDTLQSRSENRSFRPFTRKGKGNGGIGEGRNEKKKKKKKKKQTEGKKKDSCRKITGQDGGRGR